jgi:type VI secretion system protein ImpC
MLSKAELMKRMTDSSGMDANPLEEILEREPNEIIGGDHFDVLIGDFEVGESPLEIDFLDWIAGMAALAHTAFVASAHSDLANSESASPIRAAWERFRADGGAQYVGLVPNRWCVSKPRDSPWSYHCFRYQPESNHEPEITTIPINGAYAFAVVCIKSFLEDGWCGWLKSLDEQGTLRVEGQPAFVPGRIADYDSAGLMTLQSGSDSATIGFRSFPSASRDRGASLARVLAVGRLRHYLNTIVFTRVGSVMNARDWEVYLESELRNFEIGRENCGPQFLTNARVTLHAQGSGAYSALVEASLDLKQHGIAEEQIVIAISRR